jgi:hypothetical protein
MCIEDEHHRLLDRLVDEDEPDVGNIDEIDAPPFLLITAFSDEEPEEDNDIDEGW